MAVDTPSGGPLVTWYRSRIGDPATGDEARGYWIFAFGVILGVIGMVLFLAGDAASSIRELSVVLVASGLALGLAGPIIRLPLQRAATWFVYLGVAVCVAAIGWFVVAFPAQWSPQTGQSTIISLYAVGLGVMAVGGVLIPTLTDRADLEAEVSALQVELNTFRETLKDTEADEAEQAAVVADLRRTIVDSEAETTADEEAVEPAHAQTVEELQAGIADTEADEADLGAHLRLLRSSQAQFGLYEDRGGAWR
jgi:hypothetical protein